MNDTLTATSFEKLIEVVNKSDSTDQYLLVEKYLDSLETPVYENDSTVYFLYAGEAKNVKVAGDFSGWNPSGRSFSRLRDTYLWYRKESFEPDARLDYKLVINDANWILDPKNPNRIGGGFGSNSELAMPAYIQPWEIHEKQDVLKGSMNEFEISSMNTGKTYTIHLYLPPDYDTADSYNTVYFQDGADYITLAFTPTVIDNLIAQEIIKPLIGVFVVPTDRNIEYAFADRFKYSDFFVDELVPYIDNNYSAIPKAAARAIIGDSYGGNISAIIAFSNPETFGNCGIHSGAFQPNNFHTNSIVMDGVRKDINVASIWGSYEGSSLPQNMRKVKDYLIDNDYRVLWNELPEGHSWGLWRATTDEMLEFFFPK